VDKMQLTRVLGVQRLQLSAALYFYFLVVFSVVVACPRRRTVAPWTSKRAINQVSDVGLENLEAYHSTGN